MAVFCTKTRFYEADEEASVHIIYFFCEVSVPVEVNLSVQSDLSGMGKVSVCMPRSLCSYSLLGSFVQCMSS